MLNQNPTSAAVASTGNDLADLQRNDPSLVLVIDFVEKGTIPTDANLARKIASTADHYTVTDGILYYLDPKRDSQKRAVASKALQQDIMREYHGGFMGGHFSAKRLYKTLVTRWYWEKMYADVEKFVKSCPDCTFVTGSGRRRLPPLKPIPVQRPFQIVGVDIMELPKTRKGNRYVVVFQGFFTKWPLVFPVPDQKTHRLTQLLVEEVIPLFGVPEALLSDRGANLLSHLMLDVCKLLGTKKLNTTAYYPQCDGMVERFNRTLKTALRKHAIRFGNQWDTYLSGINSCIT